MNMYVGRIIDIFQQQILHKKIFENFLSIGATKSQNFDT